MAWLSSTVTGHWNDVGGPGTQSTFQANPANTANTNYSPVIDQAGQAALGGMAQANQTAGQQQNLANMLLGIANGTSGPTLADKEFQQATGQNLANTASMAGSQRGVNVATLAKQQADQTAAVNQNAAGQAGILRAQEQLGALSGLGTALGTQRAQDIGQQGANTALYGQGVAGQNSQNQTQVSNNQGTNAINAQTAAANAQTQAAQQESNARINSGFLNPAGVGQAVAGFGKLAAAAHGTTNTTGSPEPVMLSPGELKIEPDGSARKVPGKAKVAGDSTVNDTVLDVLQPGGKILPRSAVQQADDTKAFLDALMKKKATKPSRSGYGAVLAANRKSGKGGK